MSLMRTALRLQAIEALNSDPVIDRLVQGRVFDSRISALDHLEPVPTILVTAEGTRGVAWSHQNGGAPFDTTCDLVLEIAMNALAPVLDEDGKPVMEGDAPLMGVRRFLSDRRMAARLDLIEQRAVDILTRGETDAAKLLLSHVVKRVPERKGDPFTTDQTGEKLAINLVSLHVHLFDLEDDDPLDASAGPFAALPQPLRTLAEASDPDSSARAIFVQTAQDLAPAQPTEPAAPFAGIDAVLAPQPLDADAPPDRAADIEADRTLGLSTTIPS